MLFMVCFKILFRVYFCVQKLCNGNQLKMDNGCVMISSSGIFLDYLMIISVMTNILSEIQGQSIMKDALCDLVNY